jgi:Uma2 family endonuclease
MTDVATLSPAAIPALPVAAAPRTLADLVHQLGDVPLSRIRTDPPPGTAKIEDVVACKARQPCLCELVDGVLVEKAMGFREGLLEAVLVLALGSYNRERRLGVVTTASAMHQIQPNLVRLPDVAFTFWARFPEGRIPVDPAPPIAPDLAIEVLSPSNTPGEMDRNRDEYFAAGTRQVWIVDGATRTVAVYAAPDRFRLLAEGDTLEGGDLLPGFSLPLNELFAVLDQSAATEAPEPGKA